MKKALLHVGWLTDLVAPLVRVESGDEISAKVLEDVVSAVVTVGVLPVHLHTENKIKYNKTRGTGGGYSSKESHVYLVNKPFNSRMSTCMIHPFKCITIRRSIMSYHTSKYNYEVPGGAFQEHTHLRRMMLAHRPLHM